MKLKKVSKKQIKKNVIIVPIIMLIILGIFLIYTKTNKIGTNKIVKKANFENIFQLGSYTIDITNVTSNTPNPPVVGAGMIPIKWNEEKNEWKITTKDDPDWYDYSNGKWANVMLSDRLLQI